MTIRWAMIARCYIPRRKDDGWQIMYFDPPSTTEYPASEWVFNDYELAASVALNLWIAFQNGTYEASKRAQQ